MSQCCIFFGRTMHVTDVNRSKQSNLPLPQLLGIYFGSDGGYFDSTDHKTLKMVCEPRKKKAEHQHVPHERPTCSPCIPCMTGSRCHCGRAVLNHLHTRRSLSHSSCLATAHQPSARGVQKAGIWNRQCRYRVFFVSQGMCQGQ